MGESYYQVDPDGDVLVVIPRAVTPFAVWDEQENTSSNSPDVELISEQSRGSPETEAFEAEFPGPEDVSGRGELSSSEALVHLFTPAGERTSDAGLAMSSDLRIRVSSKHLVLASPHFRRMLKGNWAEANTISPDGCHHVNFEEGFDPDALLIVMNIIHNRNRQVPRSLDLDALAKVSVWVDYLECHEAVEVFSEIWITQLRTSLPTQYSRDLVLWIFIAFVFRQQELFKSVTRTAILQSTQPIRTLGLQIRDRIVG
jgi:hypothetical protein